jgi:hypothetical protein
VRALVLLFILFIASTALAEPGLPTIAERPHSAASLARSRKATAAAKQQLEAAQYAEVPDFAPVIAVLRRVVAAEPADANARYVLAQAVRAAGDKAAAFALLAELRASACDGCLAALVDAAPKALEGNGRWNSDDEADPAFLAIVKDLAGRKSAITTAASDIVATIEALDGPEVAGAPPIDLMPALRHLSAPVVRVTGEPRPGTFRGRAGFATWLRTTPGVFSIAAKGVMTCGETCCHFIADNQGADTTYYLYELCFTPSALTLKLERR